ncbi:MAG TPA: M20/M25/M40 family metallo-hydrolase [Anaerolineales bacterium]|nr:M20/M25/M40 family metallo-hydrolase [Anaerolineales bacterium]
MEDTKRLLEELVSTPGLSGYENAIQQKIAELWQPQTDEQHTSKLGSLHALRRGQGSEPRQSILIATHMDAIGLMVTAIEEGLLRLGPLGSVDERTLPGLTVTVHTQGEDLPGLVILPPNHTLPKEAKSGTPDLKYLYCDTGLPAKEVAQKVRLGDRVTYSMEPLEMGDGYFSSPALDNRASVTVLTETLKLLKKRHHRWDVWAVATVQEEVGAQGAVTSGFALRPTLGVVIDVNFGAGPGTPSHEAFEMDKGPTFDYGPSAHPKLYQSFVDLTKSLEIPYQRCVYPRSSGTDADKLQLTANGTPVMLLGIPMRYMHTPVEMLQIRDIQRTARLLSEFICQLDENFMDSLHWDDIERENEA